MKKIFLTCLAAMALASCVSDNDLNPVEKYGYVNFNVSNDPTIETRGTVSEDALAPTWLIKATKDGTTTQLTGTSSQMAAGTYTFQAMSHVSEDAALAADDNWGKPYYYSNEVSATVTSGDTESVTLACGTAQNARVKVVFPTENNVLKDFKFTLKRNETTSLEFNKDNYLTKLAYFTKNSTVPCTLTYTYNATETTATGIESITVGGAATESVITISANSNGTITFNITYSAEFGTGNNQTITIDAADGQPVQEATE